jgi:hypothetical protein
MASLKLLAYPQKYKNPAANAVAYFDRAGARNKRKIFRQCHLNMDVVACSVT